MVRVDRGKAHQPSILADFRATVAGWAAAITLVGAFFRFFLLNHYPVGFYFDEAANLFDIFGIGPGFHPIYFTNNNGREPFFMYWAALFVQPLTVSPYALRVAAAFLGVATIPALYYCASQALRRSLGTAGARRTALYASAVAAVLFFHIAFSRLGLRTISLPLFECLAFGALWQASRRGGAWRFALGGALLAGCLYTYTAARVLLLGVGLYALIAMVAYRKAVRWRGMALAALAFGLCALPLARYAVTNQAEFFERTEGVAVTNAAEVARGTLAVLAMFNFRGTGEGLQNIAGMPVFDPWLGALFLLGAVMCLGRPRQAAHVFLLIWLVSIMPASAFSPRAPYYLRLTGLIPPAAILAGLGLRRLEGWAAALTGDRKPGWAAAAPGVLLLASAGLTYHNYFQVWGPSSDAFYGLMQDKVDASAWLQRWTAAGDQVFLAPLYAQDWTYKFLTRRLPIQSFEARDCTALPPPGQAATYVYPHFDKEQPPLLLSHLPATPRVENVANSRGEPNLIAIHEPAAAVPAPPARPLATFGGIMALDRVNLPADPVHPGQTARLSLTWRALAGPPADYTVFVHADENVSHRRVARDSMPCGGSFGTSRWTVGERVEDYYALAVPADAPEGVYTVTTGLYTLPGPVNLKVDGTGANDLAVGSFRVQR